MILSRVKPVALNQIASRQQIPKVEEFLAKRDYTGALTVLEFMGDKGNPDTQMWIGYCAFHLGDYKRAMQVYEALTCCKIPPEDAAVNLACCYFFLGMYPEAERALENAGHSCLKTRLLFHLAQKKGDENKLIELHQQLQDVIEDQLSLAAVHYMRCHYQEAMDIYKRILAETSHHLPDLPIQDIEEESYTQVYFIGLLLKNREYLALNVYSALCFYKLDYFDVSLEVLGVYLQKYPDSTIAINLKACINFRLYNGKAAEAELRSLLDQCSSSFSFGQDLIRHNLVVFRGGEGALQVLPPLVDVIPEARLNLVIYYLKQNDVQEAFQLIKDLQPSVPQEYILKAVVIASLGQKNQSQREHVKMAQQYFQMVGSSTSECDTVPGRQCMASCFFLLNQFEEVLLYFSSIKSFCYKDDWFNFNYAQANTAVGCYQEAEEAFHLIQSEKLKSDYIYISHLARCYIMNKKGQSAWELYLKIEHSEDAGDLLMLIGNDCYRMGQFCLAARAFDALERMDTNPDFWEGKRGACVGLFQQIIAGIEPRDHLKDVVQLLGTSANLQAEKIIRTVRKWAKENRINI